MRRRSLRTLLLVAVAALTVAAPAAASAPSLTIKKVDTSAWPTVKVTAETPDPSLTPDLQVVENGQTAADVRQEAGARSAVALVLDTSGSMKGQKLSDAIAAATTFVQGTQSNDSLASTPSAPGRTSRSPCRRTPPPRRPASPTWPPIPSRAPPSTAASRRRPMRLRRRMPSTSRSCF